MPEAPSLITALHNSVERTYASGISVPYDLVFIESVLALSDIGYRHQQRMIDIAAAMLNSMEAPDREAIMDAFIVPGGVQRKIGAAISWPDPVTIVDDVIQLTPDQESEYRLQLERSINYCAENQAARVVTYGIRKQYTYMEKRSEAEALLALADPGAEIPADWPYLNSDVVAGIEPTIVSAAQTIKATSDAWRALNAMVETVVRTGVNLVRTSAIDTIDEHASDTKEQVIALVDQALNPE